MSSILDEIVAHKRAEVTAAMESRPLAELEERLGDAPPVRGFAAALRFASRTRPAVIAEVKKASPSRGLIRADFDVVRIGRAYDRAGAAAISVLTDERYFQGKLEYLERIRREVRVPVLRKDFVVSRYQVVEARVAGADAILLILAALAVDAELVEYARCAADLGMDVLWEVHDGLELERLFALGIEPHVVGVNNRDLRTFEVSLETTRGLLPVMPESVVKVSESGFFRRAELDEMRRWGVDAFLIGESLMRATDPGAALRELLGAGP